MRWKDFVQKKPKSEAERILVQAILTISVQDNFKKNTFEDIWEYLKENANSNHI